jgi:hypothetical protein
MYAAGMKKVKTIYGCSRCGTVQVPDMKYGFYQVKEIKNI